MRPRRSIFLNSQDRDETRRDVQPSRPRRDRVVPKNVSRPQCRSLKHQLVKSVTWQSVSCGSDTLFSSWYIRKPDALHGCSRDESHETETETRPRRWTLKTETRSTFDFAKLSRPRRSTFKTEMRQDVPKNVSRPSRDRDVQDRDYIPGKK